LTTIIKSEFERSGEEINVASYKVMSSDINTRPTYFVSSYMIIKSDDTQYTELQILSQMNVSELPNFLSL
jgi:hypothetical protein